MNGKILTKRRFIIFIMFISIFSMTMAYSILRSNVVVEGTASVDRTFKVAISSVSTAASASSNTISSSYTGTTVYMKSKTSGCWLVTVANTGNTKAKLASVVVSSNPSSGYTAKLIQSGTSNYASFSSGNGSYTSFGSVGNLTIAAESTAQYYVCNSWTDTSTIGEVLFTFNFIQDSSTAYAPESGYAVYTMGNYVLYNPVSNSYCTSTSTTNCYGWYVLETSGTASSTVKLIKAGNIGASEWGSSWSDTTPTKANSTLSSLTSSWTVTPRLPTAVEIANAYNYSLSSADEVSHNNQLAWLAGGGKDYWTSTKYNVTKAWLAGGTKGAANSNSPLYGTGAYNYILITSAGSYTGGGCGGIRPVVEVLKTKLNGTTTAPSPAVLTTSYTCSNETYKVTISSAKTPISSYLTVTPSSNYAWISVGTEIMSSTPTYYVTGGLILSGGSLSVNYVPVACNFTGWKDSLGTSISPSGTYTVTRNTTLTAQWNCTGCSYKVYSDGWQVCLGSDSAGYYIKSDSACVSTSAGTSASIAQNVYEEDTCTASTIKVSAQTSSSTYTTYTVRKVQCLLGDTYVTTDDDKKKKLKKLKPGDKVKVYNPKTKRFEIGIVAQSDFDKVKTADGYDVWTFDDNTQIKTVHDHSIYNVETQKMLHISEWKIGYHAYKEDGSITALVSHKHINRKVRHYSLNVTNHNFFINGILNGDRYAEEMHFGEDQLNNK